MKIYVFAALLLVAASHALPVEEESADVYVPLQDVAVSLDGLLVPQQEEVRADRQRRITCDLLTWGGKVGDSACAANCLSMGKAGGRCIKSICTCRKTSLKDLWKKRFGRK